MDIQENNLIKLDELFIFLLLHWFSQCSIFVLWVTAPPVVPLEEPSCETPGLRMLIQLLCKLSIFLFFQSASCFLFVENCFWSLFASSSWAEGLESWRSSPKNAESCSSQFIGIAYCLLGRLHHVRVPVTRNVVWCIVRRINDPRIHSDTHAWWHIRNNQSTDTTCKFHSTALRYFGPTASLHIKCVFVLPLFSV